MNNLSDMEVAVWLLSFCIPGLSDYTIRDILYYFEIPKPNPPYSASNKAINTLVQRKLCFKKHNFYLYATEPSYDFIKHISKHPILQKLIAKLQNMDGSAKHWSYIDSRYNSLLVRNLSRLILMNDDLVSVRNCVAAFNESEYCVKYGLEEKLELEEVLEDAACYLCRYKEFVGHLDKLSPNLKEICLPGVACSCLINGTPVPNWRDIYCKQSKSIFNPNLLLLAFLEGDKALLDRLAEKDNVLLQAYTKTLEGDWSGADKLFTRYLNLNIYGGAAKTLQYQLVCLVSFLIAIKANISITRIKKLPRMMQKLLSSINNECCDLIFNYFAEPETNTPFNPFSQGIPQSPFIVLLGMVAILQQKRMPSMAPQVMQSIYDMGRQLLDDGQRLLGIYILNAFGTLLEENDSRRIVIQQDTERLGIAPWQPLSRMQTSWELALDELQKSYSNEEPAQNAGAKTSGRIIWSITTYEKTLANNQTIKYFHTLKPIFQKLRTDGSYTQGRESSLAKLSSGEFNEVLTPEEINIKKYIKFIKDYWAVSYYILPQCLDCLTSGSMVVFENKERIYKLVKEENAIITRRNSKGDFDVSLKFFVPDLTGDIAIMDFAGDNVCRYCIVSPNDKAYKILAKYGKDGVLTVPASAAAKLSDTMAQISSKLKVTGALAGEAYRDLPEAIAKIEMHLLLERSGDAFSLLFRNKPLPEAELLMRPGIGEEMHVVNVDEKPVRLKRDLAKERKTIAEMFGKCPSLPDTVVKQHACEIDDLEQFLQILDEAREAGFILDWRNGSPIKISRRMDNKALRLSCEAKPGWLEVGGDINIDEGKVLSLKILLDKYNGELGTFVRLDDNSYLKLTKDICRQIEALKAAGTMEGEKLKVANAAMPMLSTVFQDNLPKKMQEQIDLIKKAFEKEVKIPSTLQGTLRPYQEDGFRYLARLADCKIGCCLADDMGLGKTIQLLTLLLREAANGPALVVCPASLCRNWEAEAHRFAPSLRTEIMPQTNREAFLKEMGNNCLVLCSYGILQSEEELFCSKSWHTIILDEAQAVKNYATKRSKSVKKLTADIRIASTGTPVENNLLELWSIFDFLNQGLLGSAQAFDAKFCDNGMPRPILKRLVSPLIMRRRKSEVLDDLPPKTEITLPITLSDDERAMYELLRRQALDDLENAEENSRIAILAHLTKLKRFCCHPALLENKLSKDIAASKMQRLMELVEDLRAAGNKALVFSQYVDFLYIIRDEFNRRNISYQYLDGSTPLPARAKAVNDFQEGQGDFFLISLKAGGTGLNLTAASYVILADPWWNPAVENQAADRVHRIGQTHPVTLYRLITSDTVEEKVLELHKRKLRTSEDILDATESTTITIEELMSLFK